MTAQKYNGICRYYYDAWGKLLKITDSTSNDKTNDTAFIGYKNPIRYRVYYYDNETGMYYLNSRYYDPEIGRFINPDAALGQVGNIHGHNMFIYCFNNPVNCLLRGRMKTIQNGLVIRT